MDEQLVFDVHGPTIQKDIKEIIKEGWEIVSVTPEIFEKKQYKEETFFVLSHAILVARRRAR